LFLAPAILFIIPLLGLLDEPSLIVEYWQFYLMFLGIPWLISLAIVIYLYRTRAP